MIYMVKIYTYDGIVVEEIKTVKYRKVEKLDHYKLTKSGIILVSLMIGRI